MCHCVATDAELPDIVSDPMSELLPGEYSRRCSHFNVVNKRSPIFGI